MKLFSTKSLDMVKKNLANVLVALIVIIGIFLRVSLYGDMRLSIATNDTSSYYKQANIPIFSREAFTSRRLPSYPAFFNLFEPAGGYVEPMATSYPAAPGVGTRHKALDFNYSRVVVAQAIIAILAWTIFTLAFCRRLSNATLRPIAAIAILLFAFSPAMAEWDSILMTESLSFSLFAIFSMLTLELLFRIENERKAPGIITRILLVLWAVVTPAWAFLRDSNANSLLIIAFFLILFLAIPRIRKQIPVKWVAGLTFWIIFLSWWYFSNTLDANRWVYGWTDIFYDWIRGYPARFKFFTDHGMPEDWTREWVKESGSKTYLLFLLNHPGFMITEFMGRLSDAFSENVQPFYFVYQTLERKMALSIGDIFHPLSSTAFGLPIVSGLLVMTATIKTFISENRPWFWFILWSMAMIYGLYVATFFADSAGLIRHTLGSVAFMRLYVWLFPIILAEIATNRNKIKNTPGQ